MLVADLYKIDHLELNNSVLTADVKINSVSEVFKGHFPNNPVMPGVMQIQLVKEVIELHLGKTITLQTIGRCKFLAVLNPEVTPEVSVSIKLNMTDDGIKINASGQSVEQVFFKFSAIYS